MASYCRKPKKFQLPYTTFQEDLAPYLNSKTVVISFFGPSSASSKSCKVGLVDEFIGYQVFKTSVCAEPPDVDPETLCRIEGCYSSQKKVLFLHLIGMYDTYTLAKQLEMIKGKIEEKGFLSVWALLKHSYTRALLFLFHISHILVLNHPGPRIDTTFMQIFQVINTIRLEILPAVQETLSQVTGVSPFWASSGRFCIPRVLWFFETCPPALRKGIAKQLGLDGKSQENKKVEREFEDNIYTIFRRGRFTSDASQSSLFLFPRNMDFVFMVFEENPIQDSLAHVLINSMIDSFRNPVEEPDQLICFGYERFRDTSNPTTEERFETFLQQHIDKAFSRSGFEDGSSQQANLMHPTQTPALGVVLEAANALYALIVKDNRAAASAMNHLRSFMNIDMRFSDAICAEAMPLALNTYLRDLPAYYSEEEHFSRVNRAVKVFKENTRGPFVGSYITKLEADLRRYWLSGRQLRRHPPPMEGGRQQRPHPQDQRVEMEGPVRKKKTRRGKRSRAHKQGRKVPTCPAATEEEVFQVPTRPPGTEERGFQAPTRPPTTEERGFQVPTRPPGTEERGFQVPTRPPGTEERGFQVPTRPPGTEERGFQVPTRPPGTEERGFQVPTRPPGTEERGFQVPTRPPGTEERGFQVPTRPPATEDRDYQSLGAIPRNRPMRSTGSADFGTRHGDRDFPPLAPLNRPTLRPAGPSASAPAVQGLATAFQDLDIADTTEAGTLIKRRKKKKKKRGQQNQAPPDQDLPAQSCPPVAEEIDYERLGAIPRNRPMSHMRSTGSADFGTRYGDRDFPPLAPIDRPTLRPAGPSASAPAVQGLATAFQNLDIADTTEDGSSSTANAISYKPPKYQRRKKPEA